RLAGDKCRLPTRGGHRKPNGGPGPAARSPRWLARSAGRREVGAVCGLRQAAQGVDRLVGTGEAPESLSSSLPARALDPTTVIGIRSGANLSCVAPNAPATIKGMGFKGTFVGALRA